MKTFERIPFVMLAWATTAVVVAACGSGGGKKVSCDEICAKVATECAQQTVQVCTSGCSDFKDIFADDAWNKTGECILAKDCDAEMMTDCMTEVGDTITNDNLANFTSGICDRVTTCITEITEQYCTSMIGESIPASVEPLLKLIKPSVVDCVTSCFSQGDCVTSGEEIYTKMGTCAAQCGIEIEEVQV